MGSIFSAIRMSEMERKRKRRKGESAGTRTWLNMALTDMKKRRTD